MSDYLFRGSLADLDPEVYELTLLESERQARKLILIPSESQAPLAVREAMGSSFQNIYAEGYPNESTRTQSESEILDYVNQLAHYRRYADPRYYKGVEYADIVEALARRRCAEAFATPAISPDQLYVNVQPPLRRPSKQRRLPADQSRRYRSRHEFTARRTPYPRFLSQPLRKALQDCTLQC